MESIDINAIQDALGIFPPWKLKSLSDDKAKSLFLVQVHEELSEKKKGFTLFESKRNHHDQEPNGHWSYLSVGSYRCQVSAFIPLVATTPLTPEILALPAFLGNPTRNYSNFLRQQVAVARLKGMDLPLVAASLNIEESMVKQILTDIAASPLPLRGLAHLPTEIDPIWDKVLCDQVLIKTSVLPLKLLLSKLKLAAAKAPSLDQRLPLILELRQFMLANGQQLKSEVFQLCGIHQEKGLKKAQEAVAQQRLVLPSLKNPIWLDLLAGKLNLHSQNMALNLLISRQCNAFLNAGSTRDKVLAIETLRKYFHKNHRSLRPELLLINRAMEIRERSTVSLPDPTHAIWQKILADDSFIPSEHMAYKLLLAKLRSQVNAARDPVVKIEAARRIRGFLQQNQKSMRKELDRILMQQSKAV